MRVYAKKPELEARYVSYGNIKEVIDWLGDDFYALTAGYPVTINGSVVSFVGGPVEDTPLPQRMVLIIRDANGTFTVAGNGDYLVHYPDVGYRCVTEQIFNEQYSEDMDVAGETMPHMPNVPLQRIAGDLCESESESAE